MTVSKTPSADWATKHDIHLLELKIEHLELRMEAKLANGLRNHTYAVLGGFAVINTLTLAASKLL